MPDTYFPDDEGLIVENLENGVRLIQHAQTGITKSMEARLSPDLALVNLTHRIYNNGSLPVNLSPWAITMLRLGGTAILPQPVGNVDPHGLLINRKMAFWPYTRINDPRLILRDDFILLRARPDLPTTKIGYYNPLGWIAYWLDDHLFRKSFDVHPGENYPDGGCSAEVFCGDKFVELESIGTLQLLEPGSSASLIETWELLDTQNVQFIPQEIREKNTFINK
jgi:hypothetical protein